MSSVTTQPQMIADAAAGLAQIRSAMASASAAAAGPTTGLVAAAQDEVSAAAATLFGSYAQEYQAVVSQASLLHDEFVRALTGAGNAYAVAEATNAGPALLADPFVALIMQGSSRRDPDQGPAAQPVGADGGPDTRQDALPVLGNPLADLIQPDLTCLINLGYGDPHYGYSLGNADAATPFGLTPHC
ncbi:PE family protein [Mycobacterium angelicum]|uniref:PE domain-containing protein n=1 Tax=Mycobacterium angelicum TaxID=470074 RepID=A0A1W9ZGT6_MYCAN|nr:PE family protein [Mycobacterium angelicum]MCV7199276.1 PE family protein [Mycobacterium angelicum]ORA14942.1 hypothetical protein BST12_22375 [Mycobacterium angelicum]